MNTRSTVWRVVHTYAVFAWLWSLAMYPLESVVMSLSGDADLSLLVQLAAGVQAIRMFFVSFVAYRILKEPEALQLIYLETVRERIAK